MRGFFAVLALVSSVALADRAIPIETKLESNVTRWSPERIEVKPGEKVVFVVKHQLKGGFDFHGFMVPELGITEQVDRDETKKIPATIPKELAPGDYAIGCQFHPSHLPATLVVLAPKDPKEAAKTPVPTAPKKK